MIEEGETVEDLTAFAGTVVIQGTVDGDLEMFGGDILVEGEVTGDVDALGDNVRVTGEVSAAAGNVVIAESAAVGALSAAGGNVTIEGTVGDDVEAAAGNVTLGPAAVIEGDLTYGGELNRHPDAEMTGTVTEETSGGPTPIGEIPMPPWWLGQLYWLFVNLLLGTILLAVFPRLSNDVAVTAWTETLRSGGVGLLALVAIPTVLVLIAVTIVGIPLSIAGVFAFALLVWIASVLDGSLSARGCSRSPTSATGGQRWSWACLLPS